MRPVELSIIVPAYNEAVRILPTLTELAEFSQKQPYSSEIIVVDDGSSDDTYTVVRNFIEDKPHFRLIRHPYNLGKGASVKDGMLAAHGAYRLFSDADLSTPILEVNRLLPLVQPQGGFPAEFDVVIGSRRVKGAHIGVHQPLHRGFAGRVFSVIVRILTLEGFLDTQCGFKLFTAEAAQKIFNLQTIPGFGFDVEALFIARKIFKLKVKEFPVTWNDNPNTQVRLFRDSLNMFVDLFRIRMNWLKGRYSK